jgi:TetR/AcrR family transcriptional repressor of nem operon
MEKITKGQKTKLQILQKSNQLFSEKGYNATGVDEIVGSLNLTSGVFYNYFSSKAELLQQVVDQKIQKSKELLLVAQEKESAMMWIQRILKIYLSPQHRDALSQSCPLTTLSQELIKLNAHLSSGLVEYTHEFAVILNRRLMILNPKNEGKAFSIMSLCVGALILSRLERDPLKSDQILNEAYNSALSLIEKRDVYVG